MYAEYAKDPRMKLNVGIRRRLAPLLDNGRDEVELMHAILFSLPGAPVLYYGDEIGMGDNVFLGDRDGVRTPMQWTGDRNGGFSRADFAQLYLPPLMDPVYGYQAVNVEAQLRTPTSLPALAPPLHRATQGAPCLRPRHLRAAARGEPADLRAHPPLRGGRRPLRPQPRPLGAGGRARPQRRTEGWSRRRCSAGRASRAIGELPVPAHARAARLLLVPPPTRPTRRGTMPELASRMLLDSIKDQRWFGSKAREVVGAEIVDRVRLREPEPTLDLALAEVRFQPGTHETYQLLLGAGRRRRRSPSRRSARELVAPRRRAARRCRRPERRDDRVPAARRRRRSAAS